MCDWVTLLRSRKLTEHCKPAIMQKIKVIIKNKTKDIGNDSLYNILRLLHNRFKG